MKNKRFVLDTNILVSALLIKNSSTFKVIKIIETIGVTLYSEDTLQEINQVLTRKKFDKYLTLEEKQEFILKFIERSELVRITEIITICRDSKDNKFLELAVSGKADFIITGDQDLLILNPFKNIPVITVNEFLKML
ncbi:putative toxin-antitoxin system toxin component, PIN family [Crocosphaera sp. UHCC 0190]|uniref:putative toxin-antitoxin system toxin component, PIN family n=1 Tax=Crocosphaera sp. UHCC 0190 TaxID=3110246 RepID=UPI002B1EA8FE|nr:putative toxin-antitoxin system toxin component, PIN family [Crocosphaera sp. UHCC 0190]MEA5512102.1 putative toxin-antitoxin system toxin component, PIN family [Crocosphaera sp. UHCC 0190]